MAEVEKPDSEQQLGDETSLPPSLSVSLSLSLSFSFLFRVLALLPLFFGDVLLQHFVFLKGFLPVLSHRQRTALQCYLPTPQDQLVEPCDHIQKQSFSPQKMCFAQTTCRGHLD